MTNCYFCHRPVFPTRAKVPLIDQEGEPFHIPNYAAPNDSVKLLFLHAGKRQYDEYAHRDCIESAARTFQSQESHARTSKASA